MFDFEYYTPTKVVFGKGAESKTGKLIKEFGGTRVLIHYGGHTAIRSGLLDRIKAALDAENIFHVELGGVVPNPHLSKVREGIALAKENNVDFLLAVLSLTLPRPSPMLWPSRTTMSGTCLRIPGRQKPAFPWRPC